MRLTRFYRMWDSARNMMNCGLNTSNGSRRAAANRISTGKIGRHPGQEPGPLARRNPVRGRARNTPLLKIWKISLAVIHRIPTFSPISLVRRTGVVKLLRPTRVAGHIGVYEAVRAQLDPPLGSTLAPYSRIRRARNAGDYLDALPASPDDVRADLPLCQAIVDAARKVLSQMPPY